MTGLIGGLPYVASVTQIPKWTTEDRDMIDLEVMLDGESGWTVDKVFVQIKSSTKGVEHFKEELSSRLKRKRGGAGSVDRKQWMLENHRILLNGDIKKSKSGKTERQLSDEEIVDDFQSQLTDIDEYEKAKLTGV